MKSYFLCFDHCLIKTQKRATSRSQLSYQRYAQIIMKNSNYIVYHQSFFPTQLKSKGGGDKIVEGIIVKGNIGELEEEVMAGNSRRMSKEFTDVVQGVSGRRRLLVRFHNGCENNLSSNQLTVVIVDKILVEEEPLVSSIPDIP